MNANEQRRSSTGARVLALLLGLTVVAACGSVTPAASAPAGSDGISAVNARGGDLAAEGTPRRGGTLAMGTDREAVSFDPTVQNTNQAAVAVYDSLLKLDEKGEPQPYLAESMQTTDDGRTWRMGLRDGVLFSDGTPLDAQAVISNVQRHIDKAASPGHLYTQRIGSMRAIDPRTVEFTLTEPFGSFASAFALNFTAGNLGTIVSPAALARYGDEIGKNPVGAGPFVLSEWVRDSRMVLTRNPHYWQQGMPYLDALEFRPLPDTETRYASIENGDVDLIFGGYHTELLRGMQNPNLTVYYGPGNGAEYIYFNHGRAPFDDRRMREAVVRGINLDALAATQFRGQMARASNWFGADSGYSTPEAEAAWPSYDPERARQLVQEYVAAGGSATVQYKTTNAPNRVQFAEFLQAQMAEIGITLQPQFFDLAQYSSSVVQSHDFQIAGWVGGPTDVPYPAVVNLMRTGGNANYGGYSNPEVDTLLDRAAATTDEAERTRLYQQVGLKTNQDIAVAYYSRGYLSTVAKPEVKGVVRYLTRDMFFATAWLDR
ncbi:peptide/nickel transport system substrate-binding protein [Pseudonocardia hierapolitana]|uniref:Peptide/nickel transport system substrate-binding protein n=1 Tax=Pseudonocardia hierapolitana TaxID=1128676 RepID=A0A561T0G3_9PSEU|nr:ABC transporter substrate-binding protein [Pseudonocardia hierapolitana]TWF80600.1 peptide/nickel transport system substrate-binding protein [Pseudonocardia hierapolitana]